MNGYEETLACSRCGRNPCICKKKYKPKSAREIDLIDRIYRTLLRPKGIRLCLLRWMYPEIVQVAEDLKTYYWAEEA